ncbi:Alpha-1,6-mannosylglycoprotein 6-beta-N-acetylglucosaminyltransferase B, partial [Sciurus carolinensis]|nr:Alpha-1,6-mannosylglycoprotein 6-beta-N-acetylglucosaminyltransferase B [Sciurus carolinensis]
NLGVPPGRGNCPLTMPLPFDLIYTDYHGLVKEKFLGILNKYMKIHGTVYYENQRPPNVPVFVKNHGPLPQPEFQQLLHKAKGPAPVEAIAHGCVFLQSFFSLPHSSLNQEFFPGKPTSREEPYLPYEHTCGGSWSRPTPTSSNRTSVQFPAQSPPRGWGLTEPFILAPNATHLQWAQNTSKVPGAWQQLCPCHDFLKGQVALCQGCL